MSTSVNCFILPTDSLLLITSGNDNCSTQGMLHNRGIVMMEVNIMLTSPQSAFHNCIIIHIVQHHRATRYQ